MKVLHLGKLCPPLEGGVEVFTNDLIEYLNERDIRTDLLCFNNQTCESTFRNFKVYRCKMTVKVKSAPLSLDYIKYFTKIVENYDLIHVHSPNPLAELLSLFTSKKTIIHWHSDIVRQRFLYRLYRPIQKKALERATKIVLTSPQYLESSQQVRPFISKAQVIPLGLNPKRLEEELKNNPEENLPFDMKRRKVILSIGRLVYYKGFEYLIESAKYLDSDYVIAIAGRGPLYDKLNKMIRELSLENKVFLLGRVEKIAPLLKNCSLFCLPSVTRTEAFGLVLVEALYFGKPLVTTSVPGSGMNYVNIHGVTGLVVPPQDPKALAEAIRTILEDENLYAKFSQGALERFKEFSIENVGEKVIKLYESVLQEER